MKKILCLALWMAACGWVQPAQAARVGGKVALFGGLGYSVYLMDKFNKDIDATNRLGVLSDNLGKINGGLTWNAGLTYGLSDFVQLGVNFAMLNGRSKGKTAMGGDFTVDTPATELGPVLRLVLPMDDGVNVTLNGEVDWLHAWERSRTPSADQTFSGDRVSVKVGVGAEVFATPFLAVAADVGYRYAKMTELKNGSQVLQTLDGTNAELDYSGPFFLGGLRFYF